MKKVKFYDDAQLSAEDLNNLQTYQRSFDSGLIADAITKTTLYTGLDIIKQSSHQLDVTPGRLWHAEGVAYSLYDKVVTNVLQYLPLTDRRYLAVLVRGEIEESNICETDFLVSLEPVSYQPKPVAKDEVRKVVVTFKSGIESPEPERPLADTGYVLLGYVLLDTSGIVLVEQNTHLKMISANETYQLTRQNAAAIEALKQSIAKVDVDVAAVAMKQQGSADWDSIASLAGDVAEIKQVNALGDDGTDFGMDNFADTSESNPDAAGYAARVDDGMFFPFEAEVAQALELDDSADSLVKNENGFVLPAYSLEQTLALTKDAGELSIGTYESVSRVVKQGVRTKTRLVPSYSYYYTYHYTKKRRYSWGWTMQRRPGTRHRRYYFSGYQYQSYHEYYNYTQEVTTTHNLAGHQVAQTWMQTQARWRKQVGLVFTTRPGHDVHLLICETRQNGDPDFDRCIAKTSVAAQNIRVGSTTWFDFAPFYLASGMYAAVIVTQGACKIMQARDEDGILHGSLLVSTDSTKWAVTIDKDLKISFRDLVFKQNSTTVLLRPLSLAGGITNVEFDLDATLPEGVSVVPEFRHDGDTEWYAMGDTDLAKMQAMPALIHCRLKFLGNEKMSAGINFPASKIEGGRLASAVKHVSSAYDFASAVEHITVTARVENWDDALHSVTCKALIESNEVEPVSHKDLPSTNEESVLERQWTFDLSSPATAAAFVLTGQTSDAVRVFKVVKREHFARS